MQTAITLVLLSLTGPMAQAAPVHSPAARGTTLGHCLVSVIDDVEVPAQEAGLLVNVPVDEGAVVKQGDLLAQLDDRQPKTKRYAAERERDAALAKASDDIEVRFAEASLEVAESDLAAGETINSRGQGLIAATEIRKLRLSKKRAELQIDKSKLDMTVAQLTAQVHEAAVKAADDSILRHRITAPMPGMVVTRLKQSGEWVAAGEPVLRLVRMDQLKVEGLLSAAEFNPDELFEQPVRVEIEMAHGRRAAFSGKITHISPLVTAGNKYRVRAEVVNRVEKGQWLLRPGMTAAMTIGR
jgi:multidrug efflux pump subunit AcrA (membrane-fusion protein)